LSEDFSMATKAIDLSAPTKPLALDEVPLRELSRDQFHARYGTDRFTASTLASRMRYVVKHMSTVLMTSAFSMILRDWYDFAVTISGPREMNYPMCTSSDSLLNFMFTMPEGVHHQ
jgi:N-methylhydantoinase B